MHICLVNDTRLPTKKYGGTERLIAWLIGEYLKLGHRVSVVAPTGTALPGVECIPADTHEDALQVIPKSADIVHFHSWGPPPDFDRPWIYTLHGVAEGAVLPKNTVCISRSHARQHNVKVVVYNGVNPDEFHFRDRKQDYLLFFSLIRRRAKGAERAIRLARRYGHRTIFAGGTRLDLIKGGGLLESFHPGLKFVGKVAGEEKAELFSNAKALLFPISWEEPFGLVLVESLLSGTPVVATPRGAVPELVPPEVGALFTTDEEFPDALERAMACRPLDCREWAMANFSSAVCAGNYLTLYERLLGGEDVFG
ncbi:glycosyltransferase [Pelodictyon luteolum]|uniref:Glycosyltransferase n=1 Tax=Chlorobium luteolum (strain DSM 273 / BCRC 81028 / 2530) TaxID=319225 RepID=Q3B1X6_CHLL3|nr:glycosyltransferase [Pelodictyon luteolum]ABB24655.1 glycosyltransferase [Pelodictyon luteolum DSM 273]